MSEYLLPTQKLLKDLIDGRPIDFRWDDQSEINKGVLHFSPHLDLAGLWKIECLASSGIAHTTEPSFVDLTSDMIDKISLNKKDSEISFQAVFERNPERDLD